MFDSGKKLAGVSKNVVLTPVSGLGDDAYYLAVSDQVGLLVKKGGSAFKVAVYQHGALGPKQTAERTLAEKIVPKQCSRSRRSATVQFSMVGATRRTIAFPAVHVYFAPPTVHKLVLL